MNERTVNERMDSLLDFIGWPDNREVQDIAGLARFGDPSTSQDAAKKITGRTEKLILQVMGSTTWTADELCAALPTLYPPTLKSALSRLANHKLVVATGEERPSNRGCAQTVYRKN